MGSHTDVTPDQPDHLPSPATRAGREGLDALLADPRRAVVALDFDGTLADIVPTPTRPAPTRTP
ncbi:Trehalose 6-phosphate phosphatase OS=Streptomyces fumanus OX=67302 GN=GCM10018772_30360 PE=3 SV=1 [Streptomyces fumanus]